MRIKLLAGIGVLVYAAMLAVPAVAADVTVTWEHPTQFTDDSPLSLTQIASTRVEYGSCSGSAFGVKQGEVVVPAPARTTTITGLAPGTYCFRAYSKATSAAGGFESAASMVASKAIAYPAPKPPSIVDVLIAWLRRIFGHFA